MNDENKNFKNHWFQQARFGMFVHWGLYAITGRDMWYYSKEQVDKDDYERLFGRFNPVDYDPLKWARLAKKAGMKYGVFIAKHHDGFCLWDSKLTDFKVTNTPYKKDITRMWLDAFRAEGLKVGIYYSLIDWNHPHFTVDYRHPQRPRMDELNQSRNFEKYVDYLHNQVCELMTDYGKIDIFWPDFSYGPQPETGLPGKSATDWHAYELRDKILKLQPDILMNSRMGLPGEMNSDFATPEQYIPTEDISKGKAEAPMWEACETMGSSWGYYRGDRSIKSAEMIINHIVTCASNNGNLLLNVGPTPRGRIQSEFVERLEAVGEWMDLNGESIYGTGASEYKLLTRSCPELNVLFTQRGKDVYIHFLSGQYPPYNIILKNLGGKVKYIEFVSDKTDIGFETIKLDGGDHIRILMPIIEPDPYDTVMHIVLK
jgi:alpha-L-fucosidase